MTMEKKLPKVVHVVTKDFSTLALPFSTCAQEDFDELINFEFETNDVIIHTFPKSGTTWMMNIVYLITHKGETPKTVLEDQFLFCEMPVKKLQNHQSTPFRFYHTHTSWKYLPFSSKCKYVCVIRNPKDVCTSFYHHTKNFEFYDFKDGSFDVYFKLFAEGKTDFGSYFDHVTHTLKHKDDENVLLLQYENIKKDTKSAVIQIAEFLGEEFLKDVQEPNIMDRILQQCSISSMIENKKTLARSGKLNNCPVIRRGVVGDWRNLFNVEQARIIDVLSVKYGINHLWEDIE